jgi:hypothetical protein
MRELVELTGQGRADGPPVLELQFDDILTVTSLAAEAPQPFRPGYPGGEWLWDASEGRYIILHNIGIERLVDETGLLDAILAAKDQAAAWLLSVS